jgi:hypothetical protein
MLFAPFHAKIFRGERKKRRPDAAGLRLCRGGAGINDGKEPPRSYQAAAV